MPVGEDLWLSCYMSEALGIELGVISFDCLKFRPIDRHFHGFILLNLLP